MQNTVHDVYDYSQQRVEPPRFVIQDLLPTGSSMLLYGEPGVMKSWLALDLAFSLATGSPWLGLRTVQSRTMIVNFEISPASYHNLRLVPVSRQYHLEPGMLLEWSPGDMALEEDDTFEEFRAIIDMYNPINLILDCWSGCYGGDENDGRAVGAFTRKMTLLKSNFTRTVSLVHHSNKNMLQTSTMDRSRGHSKLTGYVDSILYLVNQPRCKQVQFSKARHTSRVLPAVNMRFENYLWVPENAIAHQTIVNTVPPIAVPNRGGVTVHA